MRNRCYSNCIVCSWKNKGHKHWNWDRIQKHSYCSCWGCWEWCSCYTRDHMKHCTLCSSLWASIQGYIIGMWVRDISSFYSLTQCKGNILTMWTRIGMKCLNRSGKLCCCLEHRWRMGPCTMYNCHCSKKNLTDNWNRYRWLNSSNSC